LRLYEGYDYKHSNKHAIVNGLYMACTKSVVEKQKSLQGLRNLKRSWYRVTQNCLFSGTSILSPKGICLLLRMMRGHTADKFLLGRKSSIPLQEFPLAISQKSKHEKNIGSLFQV